MLKSSEAADDRRETASSLPRVQSTLRSVRPCLAWSSTTSVGKRINKLRIRSRANGRAEMAKKVLTTIKLQANAGQASPAPPVGPALGQHGINIMEFCKAFNAQTQSETGTVIPVVITVYEDRSFTFVTKTPPAAVLIRQAIKIN